MARVKLIFWYLVFIFGSPIACSGVSPDEFEGKFKTQTDSDLVFDSDSGFSESDAFDTNASADSETDANADTNTDLDTATATDVITDTMADGDSETARDSDADSDPQAGSDSDTGVVGDTDSGDDSSGQGDKFGHWACKNDQCEPVYENEMCGDGECNPMAGESDLSCPGDCNVEGVPTIPCNQHIDCVFLDWSYKHEGWWVCEVDEENGKGSCIAEEDQTGCGQKDKICTVEQGESDRSCPKDCGETRDCEENWNCLFNKWPSPKV